MRIDGLDIRVRLGNRDILHGIDFRAEAGEVTMIVGPNGSGKTTLVRALTGDLAFTGSVSINGRDIRALKPWRMAAMRAVLPQETALAFPFTVGEIVRIGIESGEGGAAVRDRQAGRVREALEMVDLAGFAGRFYQELSGGERQRVQLARVLCQIWEPAGADGPRWLFLDEPVSSLDIRHQLSIMDLARDFASRGGGVVAVMHDLNLTAMYGDRVAVVSNGRIAAFGPPGEVLEDRVLSRVFGCALRVGVVPRNGAFILPQSAVS